MNWTTEIPTKEGWYWIVDEENKIEIVLIIPDEYTLNQPLVVYLNGYDVDIPLTDERFKYWQGPIEIPPMPGVKVS